jgi:uncharacterized protein YyaL (SSP411 family)
MSQNQLGQETSPYLLQHRDNPVHWRAWNSRALEEARSQDKPILLSIGYAACHWCHVMARESFEDPSIASVINELYVPVKVDREEHPGLDAIYQEALQLLGGRGGWPLTMFLNPKGEPFWGGTYFPPVARWNLPAFPDILQKVAGEYHRDPDSIGQRGADLSARLRQTEPAGSNPSPDSITLNRLAARVLPHMDLLHGGLKNPPKFPNCSILEMLWRGYLRSGSQALRDSVLTTLTRMSQGGLYDHLGGGFSRYCTDNHWLVPHFEKMLYDNAQLIELLTSAWQETRSPLFRERVSETIGWLLRDMRVSSAAFASTLDAESEHEEGKYYVWSKAEIDSLLGPDAETFNRFYGVGEQGNWEGRTILNRLQTLSSASPAIESVLARCRKILLEARARRPAPARDDKILADWNGLAIAALTRAAQVFNRPDWLQAAWEAWHFITIILKQPGNRLAHSWRLGQAHPGTLDDYAQMCRAGLRLHEATGDPGYLDQAREWTETVQRHFSDSESPGYYMTDESAPSPIGRIKLILDNSTPPGNPVMAEVLGRLHLLTGEVRYLDRATSLFSAFSGNLDRDFLSKTALLNSADFFLNPLQIAVIGDPSSPAAKEMLRVIHGLPQLNRVLVIADDGNQFPENHPLHGKQPIGGKPAAYVCEGQTCSLPITDPALLETRLKK